MTDNHCPTCGQVKAGVIWTIAAIWTGLVVTALIAAQIYVMVR